MSKLALIFLDIDGTLLDSSYATNDPSLPKLIKKMQASQKCIFGLNSNRSIKDMLPIANQFFIKGPVIGENGAFAYYPSKSSTTYFLDSFSRNKLSVEKEKIEAIILSALKSTYAGAAVHWIDTDTVKAISQRQDYSAYNEGDIIVLNNAFRKFTVSAHLFMYRNDKLASLPSDKIRTLLAQIKQMYIDDQITITYDSKFSNILAYSKSVSKRSALETLNVKYMGYELYSIGDDINDYLMTEGIGTFLAVANAKAAVKARALYSSNSAHALGVTELLTKLTTSRELGADTTETDLAQLGYRDIANFKRGETNASLYRVKDARGAKKIIKLGTKLGDNSEVDANKKGYEAIQRYGGAALLPKPFSYTKLGTRSVLTLPYLGRNMVEMEQRNAIDQSDYGTFLKILTDIIIASIVDGSTLQVRGLRLVANRLIIWLEKLVNADLVNEQVLSDFTTWDITMLSGTKASLMVLDFTPDNVFYRNGKILFIDPWDQPTYQGSFLPCLAQFATLACDVLGLEQANQAKLQFEIHFDILGQALGLSNIQCQAQVELGRALQYTLSSFVRIHSDTILARKYANKAVQHMYNSQNIMNVLNAEENSK